MEVIKNGNKDKIKLNKPSGIGLGNFDGLHIGHMALINTLICESRLSGLDSVIYSFISHSENILRKELFTPLLTTVGKKIELLSETALNCLYLDEFDENFSRMPPETFIRDVLVERLSMKLAVAGFDYTFGYKGHGNSEYLVVLGKKFGFKVVVIPPIKIENEVVSSTLIRDIVAKGNMDKVFRLLGRHYSITGKVSSGRKIGSKLGFPTANIHPEQYLMLPAEGVYATKTLLDGVLYNSVTNIGRNPTFDGILPTSVETHILDFNKDIYSCGIEVFFISKVRGEKKFESMDCLASQIEKDIFRAREFLEFHAKSQI